ncbi:MAG: hypothetical protein RLZZ26_514 [Candidatus Parcubacteria bacterium]|jgi:hypothetical protein
MDMDTASRNLDYVRETPFPTLFKPLPLEDVPRTLTDEMFALVVVGSGLNGLTDNDQIREVLAEELPEEGTDFFKKLQAMQTKRSNDLRPFFTRFILFTRKPVDAVLIGVGADEMYYVVAAWVWGEPSLWPPKHDLHDRPVIV